MEELYPRLPQLRTELEQSYTSTDGLSVLFAIRRELLGHYHRIPLHHLKRCPHELHQRFDQAQLELQTAPTFPSRHSPYAATEQALTVLERVLQCEPQPFAEPTS